MSASGGFHDQISGKCTLDVPPSVAEIWRPSGTRERGADPAVEIIAVPCGGAEGCESQTQ